MGFIQTLRKRWSHSETIDLIVVVGLDKQHRLNKMANQVGGEVYLDESGSIMKALGGGGSVPHWFVLNSDNKILRHFGGFDPSRVNEMTKIFEM
ncbi:MAG: hypothetical protein KAJ10_02585 [Thermodesulfovibrionia bacterium]|nr:hypothetical protein [Thermodesulfovibrionia bacterium]MCK5504017.1 hypothetical protein [Thermodesulfovibrionia bacterium]